MPSSVAVRATPQVTRTVLQASDDDVHFKTGLSPSRCSSLDQVDEGSESTVRLRCHLAC